MIKEIIVSNNEKQQKLKVRNHFFMENNRTLALYTADDNHSAIYIRVKKSVQNPSDEFFFRNAKNVVIFPDILDIAYNDNEDMLYVKYERNKSTWQLDFLY